MISSEGLRRQLNWRYAVKRFDPASKLSAEQVAVLEEALIMAPSSYGLQPWKFYFVADEGLKKELQKHAWGQPQIVEASHIVVIAGRKGAPASDIEKFIERIIEVRGSRPEELEALKSMMLASRQKAEDDGYLDEWAARQCYIALGFLLSAAAVLGVDACPMEGFVPAEFDRVLGIAEEGYGSVVVCALGRRKAEEDWLSKLPKVRYQRNELVKNF